MRHLCLPTRLRSCWAILCLGLACLLPAAPLSAQADPAQQQFVFAYRLLQRGEDKLAAQAFEEFLAKYPKDAKHGDAAYYRALLARRAGENEAAARLLTAPDFPAPTLVPEHALLLLRGEVLIALARFDAAVAALEKIKLDGLDPAGLASTHYLLGLAYRGAGNLPGAAKSLDAAAGIDSPLKPRAMLEEARVQAQLEKTGDAQATLVKLIALKDQETAAEALLFAGDLAFRAGQFPKAIDFYSSLTTEHQSSSHFAPAVMGLLWSRFSLRQYDAVLQSAQQFQGALQGANAFAARYLAASALQEMGRHDKAVEEFKALLAGGGESELRDKATYKLAVSDCELGRFDEMNQCLADFAATFPKSELLGDAQFLLAAAQARRGDLAGGVARLTAIINEGKSNPFYSRALLRRASLYEQNNQLPAAIEDYQLYFQEVLPSDPGQAALIALRLSDLWSRSGQFEQAEALAGRILGLGAGAMSIANLEPLVEQEAMYRRAVALIKLNRSDAALQQLNALLSKHPQNQYLAQARYYRGLLLVLALKPDEALADLQAAAAAPELSEALRANALHLAGVRLREKNETQAAAATLQELEKLVGLSNLKPAEQLWLARWQMQRREPRESLKYLEPLVGPKSAASGPARAEALWLTGRNLLLLNDSDGAINAFGQVIALAQGFEPQARLELARTLGATNKTAEAIAEYNKLISVDSSEVAAAAIFENASIHRRLAQKRRLAGDEGGMRQELEEAQRLFMRLVLLLPFPELSPLPELAYLELAEVRADLGKLDEAIKALQELTGKFPESPCAAYARAVLAIQQRKLGDAEALLKKLREQSLDPRLAERVARQLVSLEATP